MGFKRVIGRFRPEDLMLIFFMTLLAVLLLYFGLGPNLQKTTFKRLLSAFVLLIIIGSLRLIWDMIRTRKRELKGIFIEVLRITRDWSPFILLVLVYENLHDLVKVIRPEEMDGALMRMDGIMFGDQPTLLLQSIINPFLTDYLTFVYGLYFVLPVVLLGILYYKRRFGDFRDFMIAMVMSFYIGFLGYMLVPAIGPRYWLADDYTVKLEGVFLYDVAKDTWNSLETINRDCFPSLHTAQSAVCLFFAFRFKDLFKVKRIVFWIYLPLVVSLWFSTVYLRYHWVIDVIAGLALAAFVFMASNRVNSFWNRKVGPLPRNEHEDRKDRKVGRSQRTKKTK